MGLYDPALTSIGLLQGGKLSKTAKDKFTDEVVALLLSGNKDGKGGSPSTKIFNTFFSLPPIPGPEIINVSTFKTEKVFWFDPDPAAIVVASEIKAGKCKFFNDVILDLLFEKTAIALDANGSTPLMSAFMIDFTGLGLSGIPLLIPSIPGLPSIEIPFLPPTPDLILKLPDYGISLVMPTIPIPPIPPKIPFPDFVIKVPPFPNLPPIPIPPKLILPELLLGLIKLPFNLLLNLVLPPAIDLISKLPELPLKLLTMCFDIIKDLLKQLGLLLIVPKLLIASLLIYVKNIVGILVVDIISMLVGSGGLIAKAGASLTGLI